MDNKWTGGLCVQLQNLPWVPNDQLAQLKVKQSCGIHLGSPIRVGELLNSILSLPDVVAPHVRIFQPLIKINYHYEKY